MKKVNVKVVPVGLRVVPFDFPWKNGVQLNLMGDVTEINNLMSELLEVKAMVNADISRFGMNLKDFSIKIEVLK